MDTIRKCSIYVDLCCRFQSNGTVEGLHRAAKSLVPDYLRCELRAQLGQVVPLPQLF